MPRAHAQDAVPLQLLELCFRRKEQGGKTVELVQVCGGSDLGGDDAVADTQVKQLIKAYLVIYVAPLF